MEKVYRQAYEELEYKYLSEYAQKSKESRGRLKQEEECPIRTCFQRDRDRIIHSKAFRRLKHKTQVLFLPEGDHYRTRLTHTLEVSQIARTISRALRLNEDLTEAIALGHDLGHTPFGHAGEVALDRILKEYGIKEGFHHARQSLRVVDVVEKDGKGLNLTYEVRDGILHHSKGQVDVRHGFYSDVPQTLEGWVVRISDSIAYLNHDLDDALRAGFLKLSDIPDIVLRVLGDRHSTRIHVMVKDVIDNSCDGRISMSSDVLEATEVLRKFLYEKVYMSEAALRERPKVFHLLKSIFDYLLENSGILCKNSDADEEKIRKVVDFIAGMTDRFAIMFFESRFLPKSWPLGDI